MKRKNRNTKTVTTPATPAPKPVSNPPRTRSHKYVTSKLSTGDVITKSGTSFYVLDAYDTIHRGLEEDITVQTYVLKSVRMQTAKQEASSITIDGSGYEVIGSLTQEGLNKAEKDASSVTMQDWDELAEVLIYDSNLSRIVMTLEDSIDIEKADESWNNAICFAIDTALGDATLFRTEEMNAIGTI